MGQQELIKTDCDPVKYIVVLILNKKLSLQYLFWRGIGHVFCPCLKKKFICVQQRNVFNCFIFQLNPELEGGKNSRRQVTLPKGTCRTHLKACHIGKTANQRPAYIFTYTSQ
jgi:hypothetical protein